MRKNIVQSIEQHASGRRKINNDWYQHDVPACITASDEVFISSGYAFDGVADADGTRILLGGGTGLYDQASIVSSTGANVQVGECNILNGVTIVCRQSVTIGSYCMMSWGSVITDCWTPETVSFSQRLALLKEAGRSNRRGMPMVSPGDPVAIEDNVWIGFGAIVLPGTVIGRGAVIGSKSVVSGVIPAYSVVVGNPFRVIRTLSPTDTEEVRLRAMQIHNT